MVFLLIEHCEHGWRRNLVSFFHSEREREIATVKAIKGCGHEPTEEDLAELGELREMGWMRFEGDPTLQWLDLGGEQVTVEGDAPCPCSEHGTGQRTAEKGRVTCVGS